MCTDRESPSALYVAAPRWYSYDMTSSFLTGIMKTACCNKGCSVLWSCPSTLHEQHSCQTRSSRRKKKQIPAKLSSFHRWTVRPSVRPQIRGHIQSQCRRWNAAVTVCFVLMGSSMLLYLESPTCLLSVCLSACPQILGSVKDPSDQQQSSHLHRWELKAAPRTALPFSLFSPPCSSLTADQVNLDSFCVNVDFSVCCCERLKTTEAEDESFIFTKRNIEKHRELMYW